MAGVAGENNKDLSDLPLIPMPVELKDLPPLPKEADERMRIFARHAIEMLIDRYKSGELRYTKGARARSIRNG